MAKKLKLGIVDDHKLFRKGIISLIEMVYPDCEIVFEADNGLHLQKILHVSSPPEIILMDVNMPGMDGYESVEWLKQNYPDVKVLVLSMIEREESIVRMLRLGVKGYLCKDVEPKELGQALQEVANKGFYYTDFVTGKLVHALQHNNTTSNTSHTSDRINDREMEFIKWSCSELTYSQIADRMFLSPKTVDGYRNSLFEKLNLKSRVGLVIYAIRNGIVHLDSV